MANKTVDQLTTFSGSMANDDLIPIFDTSESADEKLKGISVEDLKTDLNFPSMDPAALGNWIPIKDKTYDDAVLTGNAFTPEDGVKYKFVLDGFFDAAAYLQLSLGGITSGWNNVAGFTNNAYLGAPGANNRIYGEWILSPVDGGLTKQLVGRMDRSQSTVETISAYCSVTTAPTTINFFEYRTQQNNFTGTYKIYKWQEVKPIELHSYELVKEYNLDNEALSDTFDLDGEADPDVTIIYNIYNGAAFVRPNNDSDSNYSRGYYYQDGSSLTAGSDVSSQTGFLIGGTASVMSMGSMKMNLKKTGYNRLAMRNETRYMPADTDRLLYNFGYYWENTTDEVTTLNINSNSALLTGSIRVYKLAKTHLFNQTIYNDLTLNVTTTGSDTTGDGTSQKPFASIHGALDWLRNKTINNGVRVTIKIADGTYNNQLYIVFDHISNAIQIEGNTTTPGNVILNFATGQPGIKTFKNSYLTLSGMTLNGFANAEWKTAIQAHYGGNVTIRDMVVDGWGVGMQAYQNGFLSVADSIVNDCNYGVHANAVSSIEYENGTISNCTSYGTLSEKLSRIVTVSTTYTSNATDNYNGTGGQTQVS